MRYKKAVVFLIVCIACFCGQAHFLYAQSELSPDLQKIIRAGNADHAFWSITVRDSTGQILEGYNSQKLVRPASNLKLLTAAAVLNELGPNFTYKTYIYGMGSQQDSVWNGDIIIRGSGDPSISGRFYDDDRLHVLDEFYEALRAKGIKKVHGNIIGNDAYFDDKLYPDGWSWDDLSFYYAPQINALSFNNNTVDLTVYANGGIGDRPTIEWFPFDTDYVDFINEQTITPQNADYDEYYDRLLGTNTIILRSSLPKGYVEKESLSVENAPLYFLDTFKKYVQNGGIEVDGHIIVDNEPHYWNNGAYKKLAVHTSVALTDLLKQLNKKSDNFYAEMLLKTAAAERYNTQGTTNLGVALVKDFGRQIGLHTSQLSMSDGSGMSSKTLITTSNLSSLLVSMEKHPAYEIYKNSLSIAGVDGSLEHRFRNGPLKSRILAKTGYVSGVRAISGYLKAKSNKMLIFSIITNHYTDNTSRIDALHESLLLKLYNAY